MFGKQTGEEGAAGRRPWRRRAGSPWSRMPRRPPETRLSLQPSAPRPLPAQPGRPHGVLGGHRYLTSQVTDRGPSGSPPQGGSGGTRRLRQQPGTTSPGKPECRDTRQANSAERPQSWTPGGLLEPYRGAQPSAWLKSKTSGCRGSALELCPRHPAEPGHVGKRTWSPCPQQLPAAARMPLGHGDDQRRGCTCSGAGLAPLAPGQQPVAPGRGPCAGVGR